MSTARILNRIAGPIVMQEVSNKVLWGLFVVAAVFEVSAIGLPLPFPEVVTNPSPLLLLSDSLFVILASGFLVSLFLMGAIFGKTRLGGVMISVMFAVFFLDVWAAKLPGQAVGAQTDFLLPVIRTGYLASAGLAQPLPGIFATFVSFEQLTGLSVQSTFTLLGLLRPIPIALFTYLLAERYVDSPLLSAIVAVLSVIGDEQLTKIPVFGWDTYGAIFFLILAVTWLRLKDNMTRASTIAFVMIFSTATLTYPLAPFAILVAVIMSAFYRFAISSSTVGRGVAVRYSALAFVALVLFLTWHFLLSTTFGIVSGIYTTLINIFAPGQVSPQGGGSPGSSGLIFFLQQLLGSEVGSLPYGLGYILPAWFLLLYGFGLLAAVALKVMRRRGSDPAIIVAGLALGGMLFLLPGGAEWVRVLPYLAPFLAVPTAVVIARTRSRTKLLAFGLMLLIALPTLLSYSPLLLSSPPSAVAAGSYIQGRLGNVRVYFGDGIFTSDPILSEKVVTSTSSVPLNGAGALAFFGSILSGFASSRDGSILTYSPYLFAVYNHAYRLPVSSLKSALQDRLLGTNLVYDNGLTRMYENPKG